MEGLLVPLRSIRLFEEIKVLNLVNLVELPLVMDNFSDGSDPLRSPTTNQSSLLISGRWDITLHKCFCSNAEDSHKQIASQDIFLLKS